MSPADRIGRARRRLRRRWDRSVAPRLSGRGGALLGLLLSVGLLAAMFVSFDPETVLAHLGAADPALIALAAVVYASSWPIRGLRYRSILAALGYPVGVGLATGAIFISQAGNLIFPARAGDAARAYVMKVRRGVPYPSGAASLVVERVFDLLTLTVLAGAVLVGFAVAAPAELVGALDVGLAGLSPGQRRSARVAIPGAAAVAGLTLLAAVGTVAAGRANFDLLRRGAGRILDDSTADRIVGVVERFVGDVRRVSESGRAIVWIGVTSVAIWSVDVATALLLLYAFGAPVGIAALVVVGFLAVSAGNLAKVLPLSPSGIGLYEAVFTLAVVGLTATAAPLAFGVAIVDHALKNAVTAVGGALSGIGLNVSLSGAVDRSPTDAYRTEAGEEPGD